MPILRAALATARVNLVRTRGLTTMASHATMIAGLLWTLGWSDFSLVFGSSAAIYVGLPAVLALVRDIPYFWATPARRIVMWRATFDLPHGLAWAWLLGWSARLAGVGPVLAILAAGLAVFVLPRLPWPSRIEFDPTADAPPASVVLQEADVLGDTVMATPVLRAVSHTVPGARIGWLCRESNAELLDHHPLAPIVVLDPTVEGTSARGGMRPDRWPDLAARLAPLGFDAMVSLWDRPTRAYNRAARAAGIRVRAGNFLTLKAGQRFNAGAVVRHEPLLHEVEKNLAKAALLGYKASDRYPATWIGRSPAAEDRADRLLADCGLGPGVAFAALSPGTSGANRRLEAPVYGAVVRHLLDHHGLPTVLLGSAGDGPLARTVLAEAPAGAIDLSGRTSSGMLAAVIARSRIHVGCDSGPTHVAAGVGTPLVVVAVAKANRPLQWGPWMAHHRTVRVPSGCLRRCVSDRCTADICIRAVSAEHVCAAVDAVLRGETVVEPRDGRRTWVTLSLNPIVHTSADADWPGGPLHALRLMRDAGFLSVALACRPGTPLADAASAEGFDVRSNRVGALLNLLVEFDGGPIYDYDPHPRTSVRTVIHLARRECVGLEPSRVVALEDIGDAADLIDRLAAAVNRAVVRA